MSCENVCHAVMCYTSYIPEGMEEYDEIDEEVGEDAEEEAEKPRAVA